MVKLFLSAGEPSGVAIGATLMRTLKARIPGVTFAGLGGGAMLEEGLRPIFDPASTAAMWLWGNLKRVPAHRRALKACIEDWTRERPDLVITVDYQAFHLFVGTRARALGIPVLHFVGSQFWGRRFYTLGPIRRAYDHVLLIHEFEQELYDRAGIPATYVGHPLFERLRARRLDEAAVAEFRGLPGPRLGLLPGSRQGEIAASLPVMIAAAARLSPAPSLLVSCARPDARPAMERALARSALRGRVVDYSSGEILAASDAALITSGSASMEAVFFACPAAVLYRLDWFNYFFARPHIVGFIAQPNLVARRAIVPEFLLGSGNPRGVAAAAQRLLSDPAAREAQGREFAAIRERLLRGPKPSEAASDVVERMLRKGAGAG